MADTLDLLNPDTWKDDVRVIVGEIDRIGVRDAHPNYKAKMGITNPDEVPIPQFEVVIRRFDRVLVYPDGREVPAPETMTINLVRRDGKGGFQPYGKGNNLPYTVIKKWREVLGDLDEKLRGVKGRFEVYFKYTVGGFTHNRTVILPLEVLPPDYEYTGPVSRYEVRRAEMEDSASEATPNEVTSSDSDDALLALRDAVVMAGTVKAVVSAVAYLDTAYRREPYLSWILNGTVIDLLKERGLIEIDDGGKILPL